ncbi:MAG: glycosyltransferase family 9 protein [Bacteroidota bacterium]
MIDRQLVKKILVIKLRAVGDVLLSTIVLKNLRLAFPDTELDFLTEPPSDDIIRGNPNVNGLLIYDRSSMSGLGLIRLVRNRGYDLVIDLFGNPRTALVTRLSGARYRVGYKFRGRTYAYNILVEPRGGEVHNTQFNLDALERIGVAIQDRNLYFPIASADEEYVQGFLAESQLTGRRLIALNTGGGWYTKRWPIERFAKLADRISETLNATVVLTWGPGQLEEVRQVAGMMQNSAFIPPPTTLPQLGALLKKCTVVISNDSGPMHITAAVGVPVLGIFGPTNTKLQGPYGDRHMVIRNESVECLGCNLTTCPIKHPCMQELSVETVYSATVALLSKNQISLS